MLLLLSLEMIFDNYFTDYFIKCETDKERDDYLNKLNKPEIKRVLNEFSELFINNPIHNISIEKRLSQFFISDKFRKKRYHLSFLRNIFIEFEKTGDSKYYQRLINNKNQSFAFIAPQNKLAKELLFFDLYYEANKDKMTNERKKELLFKRIMKASFSRFETE